MPSGASTGEHEALELRDGDKKRYLGKGVRKAVQNVRNVIGPAVVGMDASDQAALDARMIELDGTPTKTKLGANAMLGVSLAVARAAALSHELPLYRYLGGANARTLPVPLMNILNGGAHADNNVDVQEFMVVPLGAPSFAEGLRYGAEVFHALKKVLKEKGLPPAWATRAASRPNLATQRGGAGRASWRPSRPPATSRASRSALALDSAASEFFDAKTGKYVLKGEGKELRRRGAGRLLRRAWSPSTPSSASRTAWPRTTGRAGSS